MHYIPYLRRKQTLKKVTSALLALSFTLATILPTAVQAEEEVEGVILGINHVEATSVILDLDQQLYVTNQDEVEVYVNGKRAGILGYNKQILTGEEGNLDYTYADDVLVTGLLPNDYNYIDVYIKGEFKDTVDVYTPVPDQNVIDEIESTNGDTLADQNTSDSITTQPITSPAEVQVNSGITEDSYFEGVTRTSGWDLIGSNNMYLPSTTPSNSFGWWAVYLPAGLFPYNADKGSIVYSTGGSFKVRLKGISGYTTSTNPYIVVRINEYDSKYAVKSVKTWHVEAKDFDQDFIINNASDYVDGDNNKAEFYVTVSTWYKPDGSYQTVNYWD